MSTWYMVRFPFSSFFQYLCRSTYVEVDVYTHCIRESDTVWYNGCYFIRINDIIPNDFPTSFTQWYSLQILPRKCIQRTIHLVKESLKFKCRFEETTIFYQQFALLISFKFLSFLAMFICSNESLLMLLYTYV